MVLVIGLPGTSDLVGVDLLNEHTGANGFWPLMK